MYGNFRQSWPWNLGWPYFKFTCYTRSRKGCIMKNNCIDLQEEMQTWLIFPSCEAAMHWNKRRSIRLILGKLLSSELCKQLIFDLLHFDKSGPNPYVMRLGTSSVKWNSSLRVYKEFLQLSSASYICIVYNVVCMQSITNLWVGKHGMLDRLTSAIIMAPR